MFFYSETASAQRSPVPYDRQNATKSYLTHYDNLLFLQFILSSSLDRIERQQASKELTICERKLKYWTHHANFRKDEALAGIGELKKRWSAGRKAS